MSWVGGIRSVKEGLGPLTERATTTATATAAERAHQGSTVGVRRSAGTAFNADCAAEVGDQR